MGLIVGEKCNLYLRSTPPANQQAMCVLKPLNSQLQQLWAFARENYVLFFSSTQAFLVI
jgi:hypothetical protein